MSGEAVPAAAAAAAASVAECPECSLPADGAERCCPGCGEDLAPLFAERWAEEAAARARAAFARRAPDPIPPDAWRHEEAVPWAFVAVPTGIGLFVAGAFLARTLRPGMGTAASLVAGGALVAVVVLGLLAYRRWDAHRLQPPGVTLDPEVAFRSFVRALSGGRWRLAWHLLLPTVRAARWRRPEFPEFGVRAKDGTFELPMGVAAYWGDILFGGMGSKWAPRVLSITVRRDGEDRAVGRAEFRVGGLDGPWRRAAVTLPGFLAFLLMRGPGPVTPQQLLLAGSCGLTAGAAMWWMLSRYREIVLETRLSRIDGRWWVHDATLVPALQETA